MTSHDLMDLDAYSGEDRELKAVFEEMRHKNTIDFEEALEHRVILTDVVDVNAGKYIKTPVFQDMPTGIGFELDESRPVDYIGSNDSLEILCTTNRHSSNLIQGLIALTANNLGGAVAAIGITHLLNLFKNMNPDLFTYIITGAAVGGFIQIRSSIRAIGNSTHDILDLITSKFFPIDNVDGDVYFVKGAYTNDPTPWDIRNGTKLRALNTANDFQYESGEYGFVNGFEVNRILDHKQVGKGIPLKERKYRTIVEGSLHGHPITLIVDHKGRKEDNFYTQAETGILRNDASFYLSGTVKLAEDGYHMNLKDYGKAFLNFNFPVM